MITEKTASSYDSVPTLQTPISSDTDNMFPGACKDPVNILIVDDEKKNLTVLESILDDPAYRLVRAETADEALLALVAEDYAVIILDIRMPGMTGFELAQLIKDRKKTARIPIIFLTAYYNEDQHMLEGYDNGAVDYLHKPVNPSILRSKVAVFADLHRKSRELGLANRALLAEVTERRHIEERLRQLNETLEQRVSDRTEALQDADRRKNEFLAMLAHELRNPLAPIRNAVQVLRLNGADVKTVSSASEMMERQLSQMVRLVDDLLDVSRITRGKIELRMGRIELASPVNHAIEAARSFIHEKDHALNITVTPEPIYINGDPARLTQIVGNLLNNASKFTANGGNIWLTMERESEQAVIRIRDSGRGIAAHQIPCIFDMFVQFDTTLERSASGLGIGLSLVKNLVEMHKGTIEVSSLGVGHGSEFVLRFPMLLETVIPPLTQTVNDLPHTISRRILIVDDNRDSAISLATLLKLTGNETLIGYDGLEAVASAETFKPDIILLDIGLPKLNGYEACRRIREQAWGKDIVIVALSGWGQDEDKQKSKLAGFNGHLVKPVELAILMDMLAKLQNGLKE